MLFISASDCIPEKKCSFLATPMVGVFEMTPMWLADPHPVHTKTNTIERNDVITHNEFSPFVPKLTVTLGISDGENLM